MTELPEGVYEELVTRRLAERLRAFDPRLIDRVTIDPGDAHDVLGRHVGDLARRALLSVTGEGATKLSRQVDLANQIVEAIIAFAPDAAMRDAIIAETHDLLQAIVAKPDVPGPVRF